MARLYFDFHAQPSRPGKLGILLALVGIAAVVWAGINWQTARTAEAEVAKQIAAIEQTKPIRATPSNTRADNAALVTQARIAAQLGYTWQPAFDALAATHNSKVALVSLDAVQAKSQLKLVAEARQLADAVAFIDALQQQPGVKRAALVQHEVQTGDAQKPVRFNILVELNS